MEDAQIGANFPLPGLFWIACSPARSLILTTCNNLTAKNHYSRVTTLFEALSATDRSGLMDDAFHLAR